jgi:hypothetical protein
MTIKDKIVVWAIKNIFQPGSEIIDKPGFIITKVTDQKNKEKIFLRDMMWPDGLFVNIEKDAKQKFGEKGLKALYAAGKKFGYIFSQISLFPTYDTLTKDKMKKFLYLFSRYIEASWGKINEKHDITNKLSDVQLKDFIVYRKSKLGQIMCVGAPTGMWAYLFKDKKIEGVIEHKGDTNCHVISAPRKYLDKKKLKYFKVEDLPEFKETNKLKSINFLRPAVYAKNSLKDLIDSKFFSYKDKSISRHTDNYFWCESHIGYTLEEEFKKIKGGENALFESAFRYGKEIGKKEGGQKWQETFTNYLSAIGWGDGTVIKKDKKYEVFVNYFPWTMYTEKSNLTVFRGLCSGYISGFLSKDIKLKNVRKDLTKGFLRVELF